MVIYNLFLLIYTFLAKCTAPFNGKVKQWVLGQNEVWNEITGHAEKIQKPIIWVHCASYGEFEQGLPIIEKIKADYSGYQVWLTFFSPSGYLHRKNDPTVDFITYLPMDSSSNAKYFFDVVQPKLVIFIKYEFWFYYLSEAKKRKIPTLLVAAIFRPTQIFFKWYGDIYKKMLSLFYAILVQDENSKKLISPIFSEQKISITGDTRFDRVLSTSKSSTHFDWLQKLNNAKIIIAGSTWEKDHILLASLAEKYTNLNWIVVPHHVDSISIQKCVTLFNNATTLTSFAASHQKFNNAKVIIVDQIGLLRNLYQHAYITYIGGGFGAEGIHNVLEPAAFGKPVFWGPNDEKYIEARGLVNAGGGFKIHDVNSFSKTLEILSGTPEKYTKACESSANFIAENAGATQKTMEFIYKNLLLIN
ncbi:MAG: 3-deoxy-D-manno-octulosonic acid transferase [Sediminibacterium sp.]|jgi:3-deoxy-D-manno-octulosonic-acid transferase|nr:3-deoxy-D-manno-octulosonic acid transferase [Sediminibacterium sp.]